MHQPPFLVPDVLPLAIPFGLLGVVLAILFPVLRMRRAPLARALQTHLSVNRIGSDLLSVIVQLTLSLAGELTTDGLLRTKGRSLKKLPAITATAVIHQAAPEQNTVRPFCPGLPKLKGARKSSPASI